MGKPQDPQPLDDWLGDLSDDDWDEGAAERAEQRRTAQVRHERRTPERHGELPGAVGSSDQARQVATTEVSRTVVKHRRATAALAVLLLGALGAATAVFLVRDGPEASGTTVPELSTATTPVGTETDPATTTPSTTPTTPNDNAATFTLPEGTKLQRGESIGDSDLTVSTDRDLISELQRALATAGFEPGTPDGVFGPKTEEAVVAFQQANGLSPDGIVGPATADALNTAIAG